MNDGFLNAECVLDFLFGIGFIEKSDWKHSARENIQELYYPVRFFLLERKSIISLEIVMLDKLPCVTKSSIRILSAKYHLDLNQVFSRCVL
jgi:hypothetical protein